MYATRIPFRARIAYNFLLASKFLATNGLKHSLTMEENLHAIEIQTGTAVSLLIELVS